MLCSWIWKSDRGIAGQWTYPYGQRQSVVVTPAPLESLPQSMVPSDLLGKIAGSGDADEDGEAAVEDGATELLAMELGTEVLAVEPGTELLALEPGGNAVS